MAYDLLSRKVTPRSFARYTSPGATKMRSEGLFGLATLVALVAGARYQRRRENFEARVQLADPYADTTERVLFSPTTDELLSQYRAA